MTQSLDAFASRTALATSSSRASRRSDPGLVHWIAVGALIALWWVFLAPVQVGGQTSYGLVHGTSMNPVLHEGDLVVMRARDAYEAGDLVVFQAQGVEVIHRIVGGSASTGWVTRGDNNAGDDPWIVPHDEVLGQYALRIPGWGRAVGWMATHPFLVAVLALALLLSPRPVREGLRLERLVALAHRLSDRVPIARGLDVIPAAVIVASFGLVTAAAFASDWTSEVWLGVGAFLVAGGVVSVFLRRIVRHVTVGVLARLFRWYVLAHPLVPVATRVPPTIDHGEATVRNPTGPSQRLGGSLTSGHPWSRTEYRHARGRTAVPIFTQHDHTRSTAKSYAVTCVGCGERLSGVADRMSTVLTRLDRQGWGLGLVTAGTSFSGTGCCPNCRR